MKKFIFLSIALLLGATALAQSPQNDDRETRNKEKHDKIKALAVAYITEQLDMSSEEAEAFWPVYNKIKDDHHALEQEKRNLLRSLEDSYNTLKENQAQEYVDRLIRIEKQLNATSIEMKHKELIDIIGAKRFLMLKKAEMDFRRKMIKEYKERRRKSSKN